jgi:lipopolysaccharide transport system ATP-binding protein
VTPIPAIEFDRVWKKFARGERHDSLRDVVPAIVRRLTRRRPADALAAEEFWALQDVSFSVARGEALGIIGPNGAGKSTTLKLLTRILKPTSGRCSVSGRTGALIEVAAGFHPDLTGRENVYLQGAILGMKRHEIARAFDAIVDFAGIAEFIDTPVKRYSSGMNARLGFSIAAHVNPDVLLIDEVLAVGDFAFQQRCFARLQEFRRNGVAIAFVSHNLQAIASLCDRVLLLRPHHAAMLTDVSTATSLYASSGAEAADSRIAVHDVRLVAADGRLLDGAIAPGDGLQLTVDLEARADLPRAVIGFEVVRGDGLVVFNGGPNIEGAPPLDLDTGSRLQIRIDFRAHLLRGLYRINLHVGDELKTWRPITLAGVRSFVVHETTRVAGCAELAPSYHVETSAEKSTRYVACR